MSDKAIQTYFPQYLEKKKIECKKVGQMLKFHCPFCNTVGLTAITYPNSTNNKCIACQKTFSVSEYVQKVENLSNEQDAIKFLRDYLNINLAVEADKDTNKELFEFYKKNDFSLIACVPNSKVPISEMKDWQNSEYKDIETWNNWFNRGYNLAVLPGKKSNSIIIDWDYCSNDEFEKMIQKKSLEKIWEEIDKSVPELITKYKDTTLSQKTRKGYQLVFNYDSELWKTSFFLNNQRFDIETDGGYCIVPPSKINGLGRVINFKDKIDLPNDLKELILSNVKAKEKEVENIPDEYKNIDNENFKIDLIPVGNRTQTLIQLTGLISKDAPKDLTSKLIHNINTKCCNPPRPYTDIKRIIDNVYKYRKVDSNKLETSILKYLQQVKQATKAEIEISVCGDFLKGQSRQEIEKILIKLINNEHIVRKGKEYFYVEKHDWCSSLEMIGTPVEEMWKDFKVPYFGDYCKFSVGDLILIGGINGTGKTEISQNFVKRIVAQGIKPYYVYNECGGRFSKVSLKLGLKDGDFYHTFCSNPEYLTMEKDSITIFDWLLPSDFARTDKFFEMLVNKTRAANSLFICFMQLKENGEYFAPNQVQNFPTWACKYLYGQNEKGEFVDSVNTKFVITKIRDRTTEIKQNIIPMKYDFYSKELKTLDEINNEGKVGVLKELK